MHLESRLYGTMNRSSGTDFAGADDIINNLPKEREPRIKIIELTPLSLIYRGYLFISFHFLFFILIVSTTHGGADLEKSSRTSFS